MPPSTTPPQPGDEPSCPTPATQTVASLPAPAAGQGEGIPLPVFLATFAGALALSGCLALGLMIVLGIA